MEKFNNGNICIVCDVCRVIIKSVGFESRIREKDLCFQCEEVDSKLDSWLEENKELLEDMKEGK